MKTVVFVRTTGIYNDSRATKEIQALSDNGYNVIVLGWDRDGQATKYCIQENIEFRLFNVLLPNGIGLKNIDKLLNWFKWVNRQLKTIDNIHVIHACDLDSGICVYKYCKRNRIHFIYDIYDYYVDSHFIPSFLKNVVEKKEIRIIEYADLTIICTEERQQQIKKAKPKNTIVVHNSPDVSYLPDTEIQYDYAYCGSLVEERMIGDILKAYPDNTDLTMCMAGQEDYAELAKELDRKYNGFTFYGPIPYSSVLKIESHAMCLSAIYDPSWRNHQLCAPNKFYEAMALRKPLIACKGTGIDKIVDKYQIGLTINYDVNEFYSALRYLKNHPDESKEMGIKARKLYENEYNWRKMQDRLLCAYKTLQ